VKNILPKLDDLWNIAPKNPTQTRYTRFMKMPYSDLITPFSKAQTKFQALQRRFQRGMEDMNDMEKKQ
jgi:hypothetical protein